ncbi:ribosome biogenesis protein BMS1 homolog isoform X2 [Girardinichthys multiradiatus]|nr:ribosome biogenesis protein BMS1 homolog isoform X2 [Girardinichthys multiradiatus]
MRREKSNKSQTEDESSHSGEDTTKQSPISDQTDSAESTDDEENNDPTDQLTISHKLQHTEKTSGTDKQSDEQNGTEKKNDFTKAKLYQVDRPDKDVDVNPGLDSTTSQLDLDLSNLLSAKEISNADMWEVGASEYEGKDQQDDAFEDKEIVSSEGEEDAEVAEPVQSLQYFAHGNMDICASELGGIKRTLEDGIYQDDAYAAEEEETMKYQLEETDVELLPSQYEIPQENHQEAENHAQKLNERETTETEASYEETSKSLAHSENSLDNRAIQKEDSLVEMSFEDVPEDQCITDVLEKNSEEDASIEVAPINISELPQKEEFKELTTCSTVMFAAEYQHKTEMEIIKREVISEEEELSYRAAFDTLKEETNNLNYSNDGERELGSKTPELANKIKDHENEHIEEIPDVNRETEEKKQSNEQDDKEDETTDVSIEGYSKMDDQEINNSRVIQNPSQLIELDMSVTGIMTEDETLEENQEHLLQPMAQSPKTIGESQSEDVREEKWDTFKQEEEMANSEVQEQSEEPGKEETITPTGSADWTAADRTVEERPAAFEKDTSASANKSDKVILVVR